MKDRLQLLIDILLDKAGREDERDDAAIDLREYVDLRALLALTEIAADPNEDHSMVDNCAESIGEISVGLNQFYESEFRKITPSAQEIVFGFIMAHSPELIKPSLKTEFSKKFNSRAKGRS